MYPNTSRRRKSKMGTQYLNTNLETNRTNKSKTIV